MKSLLVALGLEENATEAQAVARFAQMQLSQQQLLSLAGVKELPQAVAIVATWKAASDALPAVQKKVAELEAAGTNGKKTALLDQAKKDGKVSPALEPWLMTLSLEQVEEFVAKAAPVSVADPKEKKVKEKDGGTATASLSQTEKAVAAQMGISEADMEKHVAKRAALMAE
jgi:phage I-like protein